MGKIKNLIKMMLLFLACAPQASCTLVHKDILPNRKAFAMVKSKVTLMIWECTEDKNTKKKNCKYVNKGAKVALGSGTFFMHRGFTAFLSAAHVCLGPAYEVWNKIPNNSKVETTLVLHSYTGHVIKAKIRYIDLRNDICIMDAQHPNLKKFPIISIKKPIINEKFYTVAAPASIFNTGMVPLYEGRHVGNSKLWTFYTIPTAPGASGAAIYNSKNRIVGIVQRTNIAFHHITLSIKWDNMKTAFERYSEINREGIETIIE